MTAGNQWDLRCPGCGRDDEIDIAATVRVRLCPDGTDATLAHNGDHEWGDDSPAHCHGCDFQGRVRQLRQNQRGLPRPPP
jgi:hypothetical protein